MDCEAVRENVEAWALGALPEDDARAVEAHMAGCGECRALADEALETAASIALAVPMKSASATLKSRVLASAAVLTDLGEARRSRLWPVAVAALVIGGVAAASWGAITQLRMNDLEDRNAALSAGATAQSEQFVQAVADQEQLSESLRAQDAALAVALEPDAQRTEMVGTAMAPDASGNCIWSSARASGALVVSGLPAPPHGSVYTMWIVYENEWLDAGDLTLDEGGEGRLLMQGPSGNRAGDWGAFEGFAVTMEPADGSGDTRGATVMRSAPPD